MNFTSDERSVLPYMLLGFYDAGGKVVGCRCDHRQGSAQFMRNSGDKLDLQSRQSLRSPRPDDEHPHTHCQHQKNSKANRQISAAPAGHCILEGSGTVLDDQLPAPVFRPLHDYR